MSVTIKNTNRIGLIDALRGFAMALIFIIHMQLCFNISGSSSELSEPSWLSLLDGVLSNLIISFFSGKAYSIFAMLFGVTFYIQSYNQLKKGFDFGYRFLWRMFLLMIFGLIDSLFYTGDILAVYAVMGVVLFVVRKWSDRAVFILALILLAQPIEWTLLLVGLFKSESIVLKSYLPLTSIVFDNVDLKTFFYTNITEGLKNNVLGVVSGGRFLQIPGLFLLGYLIGRRKLFVIDPKHIRFWIIVLISTSLLYVYCSIMKSTVVSIRNLFIIFSMWSNLALTFVLVSSFVVLYQNARFVSLTGSLCYLGRMTLSLYIFQSIVGVFLFLPLGLGLGLGNIFGGVVLFLLSLVLVYLQIVICRWWLSSHKQGPLEMLWHKLTWIGKR